MNKHSAVTKPLAQLLKNTLVSVDGEDPLILEILDEFSEEDALLLHKALFIPFKHEGARFFERANESMKDMTLTELKGLEIEFKEQLRYVQEAMKEKACGR